MQIKCAEIMVSNQGRPSSTLTHGWQIIPIDPDNPNVSQRVTTLWIEKIGAFVCIQNINGSPSIYIVWRSIAGTLMDHSLTSRRQPKNIHCFRDFTTQFWNTAPNQRNSSSKVWSSHRCSTHHHISPISLIS
jgi:hypothetical protein